MDDQQTVTEVKKAQYVRLLDVGVFGPLMIYTALGKTPPPIVKNAMVLIGIGTIVYNGYNYLEQQKALKKLNRV